MIKSATRNLARFGFAAAVGVALWVALGLSGCASSEPPADNPNVSYTASDAPDARKRATNRLQLAVLYFQDGKTTFALDEVKQAILADPGWYEPYWMRGLIQMQTTDYVQAESSFQRALGINPNAADLKHNYGILLCKMKRYDEGLKMFAAALASPTYGQIAKTYLEQGNCLLAMGNKPQAESSYQKSYELDASNAVTAYHMAALMFERNENVRAQFYARRINNSEQASAESLWLGIKIERRIGNADAANQLAAQLRKRFGQSSEAQALERGSFDE